MSTEPASSREDFRRENLSQWSAAISEIFPNAIPSSYEWKKKPDIMRILNKLGSIPSLNHTFLPTGGGLDLAGCTEAGEADCVALDLGTFHVLKPRALQFEAVTHDLRWAYFRLEAAPLPPTGISRTADALREILTEIGPGSYLDGEVWERGYLRIDDDGSEVPLPEGARSVRRYLSGAFVVFAKGSAYNADASTYDGRHNAMTAPQFRQYVHRSAA